MTHLSVPLLNTARTQDAVPNSRVSPYPAAARSPCCPSSFSSSSSSSSTCAGDSANVDDVDDGDDVDCVDAGGWDFYLRVCG